MLAVTWLHHTSPNRYDELSSVSKMATLTIIGIVVCDPIGQFEVVGCVTISLGSPDMIRAVVIDNRSCRQPQPLSYEFMLCSCMC